ncbi:MAG: hypothetical protein JXM70_24525, partial [Pirellulales bacterium]|nr:hypothetical protein [Pirellulales bacterium]
GGVGTGNIIAFNTAMGVAVTHDSVGNRIQANSIHSNGGLGIDLAWEGVTPNDPLDEDLYSNCLQNFPIILKADAGVTTHAVGTLNSMPNTDFTIDFYANTVPDPSGYGEGERWLGSTNVTTDENGDVTFDVTLAAASYAGETFTATATDPDGNTSEFSGIVSVNPPPLVELSGRVFNDLDNDGLMEVGESGIYNVALRLTGSDDNGPVDREVFTDVYGFYVFKEVGAGTYTLLQVAQPAGFLDGMETAGSFGGIVYNTQDSNLIDDIMIEIGDTNGSGYDFAEIRPSRIGGLVWEDFNDDSEVNFGESAIAGVEIHLSGIDDRDTAVDILMATDDQGLFEFTNLRPGDYALTETQPVGYPDGKDSLGTVNEVLTGDATVNDQFTGIMLPRPGSDGVNYNFGERPSADSSVTAGQAATIGFWQNKHGQALIKALNGGPDSTQLGDWLAATFPNMYGANAGTNNLAGMSNSQVADLYKSLFKRNGNTAPGGPPKLDAQVLAVAFAVYVTNVHLVGTTAADYGFLLVTEDGLGVSTFDVGEANRAAFGLSESDSTVLTVMDILLATDTLAHDGLLYDQDGDGDINQFEQLLRTMANEVYSAINEQGDN